MSDKKMSDIPESDRERFDKLFNELDKNKDGTIDVSELTAAFGHMRTADKAAETVMSRADVTNQDKLLSADEFAEYMARREKKLKVVFTNLDRNQDGSVEPEELMKALKQMGIIINLLEAKELIRRLDKDKDCSIDWSEWRDFFGIYPGDDLSSLMDYWRNPPMVDIGEAVVCPPAYADKPKGALSGTWKYLVAGGLAGAVSRTCTAPLDRLKVMMQVYGSTEPKLSVWDVFKRMVKEGGWRSLWRGNGANVTKIAPESALKFFVFERLKTLLLSAGSSTKGKKGEVKQRNLTVIERFAAGSTAGVISQTAIFPMEVIKTRLAVGKTGQYKGMVDCAIKLFKSDGIKPFYRGYLPNIIGIIPYAGIDLSIYETLKMSYKARQKENQDPGVMVLLACGTVSSTCGQLASYPFALLRTRLQAQATADAKVGPLQLTKNIMQKEGLFGLYRGILPNFIKVLPAVSISYVVYEHAKGYLGF